MHLHYINNMILYTHLSDTLLFESIIYPKRNDKIDSNIAIILYPVHVSIAILLMLLFLIR